MKRDVPVRICPTDIHTSEWISYLRPRFEVELITRDEIKVGTDFDLSYLTRNKRWLTQKYRHWFTSSTTTALLSVGLRKRSGELAIFEESDLKSQTLGEVRSDDLDLREGLKRSNLMFDPLRRSRKSSA
jgi:hypothetical protein